jgi:hypothetical protein
VVPVLRPQDRPVPVRPRQVLVVIPMATGRSLRGSVTGMTVEAGEMFVMILLRCFRGRSIGGYREQHGYQASRQLAKCASRHPLLSP